jgi:dTDP-3-amino-2,3,6-trideoxy-4-keto-D-glucose/dTDP-3-amino-3,4,6-trideoxy-alpha-D-glucose/dTDP-2,6-dideoxy-D-kanosamine transaminase
MTNMTQDVPFFSTQAVNANVDVMAAVKRVVESYWYVLGTEVANFEVEFARYVQVDHCISLANGTDALELALRSIGVSEGDLVVTVANAGFYSSTAIHAVGANPLYVDVDINTLTMSPAALRKVLEQKPKAVVVTHLYGQLAAIEELAAIADAAGILLIEDCAQSHGARRNGKMAGSFGAAGCFSFYPTKNIGALGDGGAVVTSDSSIAENIRTLRQYGWSRKYHVAVTGGRNSRLDEIQAAILRDKIPYLDQSNEQRRAIALSYNAAFKNLPVRCPSSLGSDYVAHLYVLRLSNNRHTFQESLKASGIATNIHYPIPDHHQSAYPLTSAPDLAVTEASCASVISLPCYPGMCAEDVERVIFAVLEYFQQK